MTPLCVLFEVVGKRGTGKTGLGIFAASVWCGDENSSSGGAETWFNTLNAIGEMRPAYSDRILVLDETNLIDADLDTKEGSKHLSSVIMQLQQTGEKVRYGDVGPRRHSRVVAFSTSNETLANLVKSKPEIRAAVLSRMVTILISKARNFGIFDHIPLCFETSERAVERLRAACDENYGVFGEAFVRVIVAEAAKDPEAFKVRLRGLLEQAHLRLRSDVHHKRVRKALAFAMVAGHLAQRHGIIPKEWGSFVAAVKAVQVSVPVEEDVEQLTASQRLLRYARDHLKKMINVSTLTAPIARERFDASPGALLKTHGATKLMIPVDRFKAEFSTNHTEMLRELRAENRLTAEGSKMVVKIPRALCLDGRCYLIDITKRP